MNKDILGKSIWIKEPVDISKKREENKNGWFTSIADCNTCSKPTVNVHNDINFTSFECPYCDGKQIIHHLLMFNIFIGVLYVRRK